MTAETDLCKCGHSRGNHGVDPDWPGHTNCDLCSCVEFEPESSEEEDDDERHEEGDEAGYIFD